MIRVRRARLPTLRIQELPFTINLTVSLVGEPSGDPKYLITVVEDITERKQTEEVLRQRNQELALLNRVGQALNSTLDLDQVLATILEEVRYLLGVIASSIWLVAPETDGLVCRQAIGPKNSVVRGWQLPMGEGIAGWVAYHGQSLIVPDVQDDERYFEGVDRRIGLGLRSVLCVPLRVRQDVIGVLQVVDTKIARFGERDQALLESLAVPAATAVENARLYKLAQLEIAERKRAEGNWLVSSANSTRPSRSLTN